MLDLNLFFYQGNNVVGDIEGNVQRVIEAIIQAKNKQADVLLFPELFIPGYLSQDLFFQEGYAKACENTIDDILPHTDGICVIIGNLSINKVERGKALFNSAYVLANQKILGVYHKQQLPTYDIFSESRYFETGKEPLIINYKNKRFGISICEDIWYSQSPSIYPKNTLTAYENGQLDALINLAASPFHAEQNLERKKVLSEVYQQLGCPIYYANAYGAHTNIMFDGQSAIYDAKGLRQAPMQAGLFLASGLNAKNYTKYERIEKMLCLGIRDYFEKLGFKQAILGLSGGVDSALVAALACQALGAENVLCILLPSAYSSAHSISDSLELVKNLGCQHDTISIDKTVAQIELDLDNQFTGTEVGIAEENIQSRTRALLLMAISNKKGHLLLNTSNKSESAVGYGTLYGDMCGALSVIGDLYKTEVYGLCAHLNEQGVGIPESILSKAPSAELRPNQKDSDSLPDYGHLDSFLYDCIEEKRSLEQLRILHGKHIEVDRMYRLVHQSEYKRFQLPPVLRVSKKSFGEGRRIPIVRAY